MSQRISTVLGGFNPWQQLCLSLSLFLALTLILCSIAFFIRSFILKSTLGILVEQFDLCTDGSFPPQIFTHSMLLSSENFFIITFLSISGSMFQFQSCVLRGLRSRAHTVYGSGSQRWSGGGETINLNCLKSVWEEVQYSVPCCRSQAKSAEFANWFDLGDY